MDVVYGTQGVGFSYKIVFLARVWASLIAMRSGIEIRCNVCVLPEADLDWS